MDILLDFIRNIIIIEIIMKILNHKIKDSETFGLTLYVQRLGKWGFTN